MVRAHDDMAPTVRNGRAETGAAFAVVVGTAAVAATNSEPANEVTTPAPEAARVMAAPPSLVMTVYAFPAMAMEGE
jgi:hypothetical protein